MCNNAIILQFNILTNAFENVVEQPPKYKAPGFDFHQYKICKQRKIIFLNDCTDYSMWHEHNNRDLQISCYLLWQQYGRNTCSRRQHTQYRGILLLSLAVKIYNKIINTWPKPKIYLMLPEEQVGFRRNKLYICNFHITNVNIPKNRI